MDINFSKTLLMILIENAANILNAGFGVNHAESALFQIIDLLKQNGELRKVFLKMVAHTLGFNDPGKCDQGMVPIELIELATHELKWPEFKVIAEDRLKHRFGGNRSLAVGDVSLRINEAYSDNWEDREFYPRYQC